jgi:hypothetical protein
MMLISLYLQYFNYIVFNRLAIFRGKCMHISSHWAADKTIKRKLMLADINPWAVHTLMTLSYKKLDKTKLKNNPLINNALAHRERDLENATVLRLLCRSGRIRSDSSSTILCYLRT